MTWQSWIAASWGELAAGGRLSVPPYLIHPRWSGFEVPTLAEPAGQTANWVLSLNDCSRLHVHEFSNGALVAHRDATDPKRSPLHALWHWSTESTSGRIVVGVSAVAGVVYGLTRFFGPRGRA